MKPSVLLPELGKVYYNKSRDKTITVRYLEASEYPDGKCDSNIRRYISEDNFNLYLFDDQWELVEDEVEYDDDDDGIPPLECSAIFEYALKEMEMEDAVKDLTNHLKGVASIENKVDFILKTADKLKQ
jgi:DNA-dependent RNA polymerase auxiliary subunit epsilon